jgi:hypothetical protein
MASVEKRVLVGALVAGHESQASPNGSSTSSVSRKSALIDALILYAKNLRHKMFKFSKKIFQNGKANVRP